MRDASGRVLGHVAAVRFDPGTCAPRELVVSRPDGEAETVPARGMRVRLDHVAVALVGAPVATA